MACWTSCPCGKGLRRQTLERWTCQGSHISKGWRPGACIFPVGKVELWLQKTERALLAFKLLFFCVEPGHPHSWAPVFLLAFCLSVVRNQLKKIQFPHSISCFGRLLFIYEYLRNLQQGRYIFYRLIYSLKICDILLILDLCSVHTQNSDIQHLWGTYNIPGTILSVLGIFPHLICDNSHRVGTLTLSIS